MASCHSIKRITDSGDTILIDNPFYGTKGYIYMDTFPQPQFVGNLDRYIKQNLRYSADVSKQYGVVVVHTLIDSTGRTDSTIVIVGQSKSMDEEAVRLIKNMPKWKPAEFNGKRMRMWYNILISFTP